MKALQDDNNSKTESLASMMAVVRKQGEEIERLKQQQQQRAGQAVTVKERSEYEAKIKQHLLFIDQLIADKKELSDSCEKLFAKIADSDKKYTTKFQTLQERYQIELKKQKEVKINLGREGFHLCLHHFKFMSLSLSLYFYAPKPCVNFSSSSSSSYFFLPPLSKILDHHRCGKAEAGEMD